MNLKEIAKRLQSDYIPGGERVDEETLKKLRFRRTREYEVMQCGCTSHSDPQSGPIYCGQLAEWTAETPTGTLNLCERHFRSCGGIKSDEQAREDDADAALASAAL